MRKIEQYVIALTIKKIWVGDCPRSLIGKTILISDGVVTCPKAKTDQERVWVESMFTKPKSKKTLVVNKTKVNGG